MVSPGRRNMLRAKLPKISVHGAEKKESFVLPKFNKKGEFLGFNVILRKGTKIAAFPVKAIKNKALRRKQATKKAVLQ